jgi:hypothetical protein
MSKSAFEKMAKKPAANDFSISCTFGPVAENGTGKNEKLALTWKGVLILRNFWPHTQNWIHWG